VGSLLVTELSRIWMSISYQLRKGWTMVFGIFIDVPLLTVPFFLMLRFRKHLSNVILRLRLPVIGLYVLLSVPLLIFEEQIDCMPSWCGTVVIPPTIPFLLLEMMALAGLVLVLHAKSPLRVTLAFSIYGVLFELFLGGLVGAPVVIAALLAPYVAMGYAFVSVLPLSVLMDGKKVLQAQGLTPNTAGSSKLS
jgi:hypothetical protein